jgi:hypothetical protein
MRRVETDLIGSNIYLEDCLKTLAVLNVCVVLGLCCAEGLRAQQSAQQNPAPDQNPPPAFPPSSGTSSSTSGQNTNETGRRFSGGITVSGLGFGLIPGKTSTVNNSATVSTENQTTGASSRFGYGLTGRYRITEHFSVDVSALFRRIGYQFTSTVTTNLTTILNGITTTSATTSDTQSATHARLFDFPLVLRYYSSPRRAAGARGFIEVGGAYRWVNGVTTWTDTTDTAGNLTCCTLTPDVPAHRSAIGLVAGAGLQFIDPVGIHVVPEFRYTRWIDQVFENLTTRTSQNQLEVSLSLTY